MFITLASLGAAVALLVYSNIGQAGITEGDNVGNYTYRGDTCDEGDAADPINVVFYNDATAENVEQGFDDHPGWSDHDGETQYFKHYDNCYEMGDQPSSNQMGLSRYHARYHRGLDTSGEVEIDPIWGDYTIAAAHYEDWIPYIPFVNNCDSGWVPKGDHAVPEDGFNEGRDNIVYNWTQAEGADHHYSGTQTWHNTQARVQCNGEVAQSDGNVAFIRVQPEGMNKNPTSSNLWYCYNPDLSGSTDAVDTSSSTAEHWCDADLGEGRRYITEQLRNPSGIGLGEFSFRTEYSDSVFVYAEGGEEGFLASTGRSVTCSEEWDSSYTTYTYNCQSSGSTPGPTGNGDLAVLIVQPWEYASYYRPTSNTNVDIWLEDRDCQAKDVTGMPLPGSNEQGYLPACDDAWVTLRMLEGDIDSDCEVDVVDCQNVGFSYGAAYGDERYYEWIDVNPQTLDGRIDLKDLQFTCGRWGSTCQAPLPCYQSGLTCPEEIVTRLAATESDANVRVDPANQNVTVGQQFTVDVLADDVSNLGAYEFTLEFDPSTLSYVGASDGSFLGSSGREVFCPDPIAGVGTVTFGCGTYRFGTAGPSGSGQLAQVTFQAMGEGPSPLDLTMVDPMDPLAKEISASAENGSVSVGDGQAGPVGGIAEISDAAAAAGGSPSLLYAVLAGAAGVVVLAAGGWYARRRRRAG
jgi:hypothetical protein